MDLTTSLIIFAMVVALDGLLVTLARASFKRRPLEERFARVVRFRGKPLFFPTLILALGQNLTAFLVELFTHGKRYRPTHLIVAGLACVIASQALKPAFTPRGWTAWALLAVGLAAFAAGTLRIDRAQPAVVPPVASSQNPRLRNWQIGLLALSLPLSIGAPLLAGQGLTMRQPILTMAIFLLAIAAVTAGAWPAGWKPRPGWKRAALTGAGLAVAAVLPRVIFLDTLPIVMNGDEGTFAQTAVSILNGSANNLFTWGGPSYPLLGFLPIAAWIGLLGHTVAAARLASALAGALTVAAVYFAGRKLFNPSAALLAALFLAVMHFHLHFSRMAIHNIWDGLYFTFALACLWQGWRTENRGWYLLAGLALGLSQYFYVTSRGLLLIIPVFLLGLSLRDWPRLRRAIPNLAVMGFAALVVFVPLARLYLKYPQVFTAPMARQRLTPEWFAITAHDMNTTPLGVMLKQFKLSALAYTDVDFITYYASESPMLLAVPVVLFLLGTVFLLVRRQWSQAWLLGLWLGFITLTNMFSLDAPASQRYVAATPAVALLVGYGLASCRELLEKLWPRTGRLWQVLVLLLMAWTGWREIEHYFIEYGPHSYFDANTLSANVLARYLQQAPPGTEVCLFGEPNLGWNSIPSLAYLNPQLRFRNCGLPWSEASPAPPQGSNTVFAFLPHREDELPVIQNEYPGGELLEVPGLESPLLMWIYDTSNE